jgi:hypothetical protein
MDTHHLSGPSERGSVVVDVGGEVGAAIVSTPASLIGYEIEIRRRGAPWDGTHVAVRERHVAGGLVYAALFSGLGQGHYEVRLRGVVDGPATDVNVEGGRVSKTRLRTTPTNLASMRALDSADSA